TILFGEFSNFEPNWPQYAPLLAPLELANFPFNLITSAWTGIAVAFPDTTGYNPLNNPLPLPPPSGGFYSVLLALSPRIQSYGSGHTQGANFAFCDGSVHFISNAINNAAWVTSSAPSGGPAPIPLLGALCTRAGEEVVDASQY